MLQNFEQNPEGTSYLNDKFAGFVLDLIEKNSKNRIVTHHLYQEVIEDVYFLTKNHRWIERASYFTGCSVHIKNLNSREKTSVTSKTIIPSEKKRFLSS